jgi:alpha-galactosidase
LSTEALLSSKELTRREMLVLALASPLVKLEQSGNPKQLNLKKIMSSPSAVVPVGASADTRHLKLIREWKGPVCRAHLVNVGRQPVRVKEVVLFDLSLSLSPQTNLYGEGFQMLSQSGGTLGQPVDLGNYTDAKHYKMLIPPDARCFYGMMTLSPPGDGHHLLAFTSCRRFVGQFYLRRDSLQVVVDTEGLEIKPGEKWELEEFTFKSAANREQLVEQLAARLIENHPPLSLKKPPTGWCSWYCFGPRVTAAQVLANLEVYRRARASVEIHSDR